MLLNVRLSWNQKREKTVLQFKFWKQFELIRYIIYIDFIRIFNIISFSYHKVSKRVQSQKIRTKNREKQIMKVSEKFADVHKAEKRKRYADAGKEAVRKESKKQRFVSDKE